MSERNDTDIQELDPVGGCYQHIQTATTIWQRALIVRSIEVAEMLRSSRSNLDELRGQELTPEGCEAARRRGQQR